MTRYLFTAMILAAAAHGAAGQNIMSFSSNVAAPGWGSAYGAYGVAAAAEASGKQYKAHYDGSRLLQEVSEQTQRLLEHRLGVEESTESPLQAASKEAGVSTY